MGGEIVARAHAAFTRVLAASIAAALAYGLARLLLGQEKPIFAAITAIICLAPGIPSHFRQSVNILIGVSTGIVVGDLAFLLLPGNVPELQMALAVFIAMLAGAALVDQPVVPIQAGSSALLVILMGPHYAGLSRFLDVLIGIAVGLAFAVIFFRARLKF